MIKVIEFQAKNVEKALEKASDELKIPVQKIKHEVMTYGSTGIFGLVGVKKAKIKVFIEVEEKKILSVDDEKNKEYFKKQNDCIKYADDKNLNNLEVGKQKLKALLRYISNEINIESAIEGEKFIFKINGGDSGVLIGKRGQTLEAIQYIIEKIINKQRERRVRVIVDVEGYLEKRHSNLIKIAQRMAEKAKKIKKPVTIGQLNAHDRRIIHLHLKDDAGVITKSVGDGYYRKLMIFPKKGKNSKTPKNKQ